MEAEAPALPPLARKGSIKDLRQDPANANKGKVRGAAALEESLQRYGAGRSIVVDRNGIVIGGNKTLETVGAIGMEDTIVVPTDGRQLVVVQRTDLDLSTDIRAKELAVVDNRTSELSLDWDADVMAALDAAGADLDAFFREDEREEITAKHQSADEPTGDPLPEMELRPFEHHDYVMVVCRDTHEWSRLCEALKIAREEVAIAGRRRIGLGRVVSAARLFTALDKA
jgi:hypothetical protein